MASKKVKKVSKKSAKKANPNQSGSENTEFANLKTELDTFNQVLNELQQTINSLASKAGAGVTENKKEYLELFKIFKNMMDRSD